MVENDMENQLRNLKNVHLTEEEIIAYLDQELDHLRRARVEAHVKECFRCERELMLLREESQALSDHKITADDIKLVERIMEQMGVEDGPSPDRVAEPDKKISLRELFAESLRQLVSVWQFDFTQQTVRGVSNEAEEIWEWESGNKLLQARAILEENGDINLYFSSKNTDMEGLQFQVRIGPVNQKAVLERISESEVSAKFTVPRLLRPRNMADISIEILDS